MAEIDKKQLYGNYTASEDRRARYQEKLAYKAADMALEEDVNIQANRTGISTGGALGLAGLAGLPSLALAAFLALKQPCPPAQIIPQPVPIVQPVPASAPVDQKAKFQIQFYDQYNNPVDVPRRTLTQSGPVALTQ